MVVTSRRYIDAAINGGPSVRKVSHTRLPAFKATVMGAMPRLVERDSSATAGLVLSSFPQEHAAAVRQLQGSPNLQYMYLKAALQVGPKHHDLECHLDPAAWRCSSMLCVSCRMAIIAPCS